METRRELVHPLDDMPEEKRPVDKLGLIERTRAVTICLYILRIYTILMACTIFHAVLVMATTRK